MSDVFISYARSTATQAQAVAEALRGLGYSVWIDDELPAHRTYTHVIEEQMAAAKAALVIWSAEGVKSEWVLSEANRAREDRKLVQVTTDGTRLPMPFDTIQCADLAGWTGDPDAPGWRKVVASIGELIGGPAITAPAKEVRLPQPSKPSIAVMPFANLSGDPEQDYFADGMVVEVVAALTRIRSIFVIASGSTMTFKGKSVSPQEVAHRLGVRYVLEGSVRKAGSLVRIAVQLIDATDGAQVWADRFEDTLDDVFALQDKVALSVAAKIEPTVREAEIRRVSRRPTDNMDSYDLFLRALPRGLTFTRVGVLEALDLAERAIKLDPDFGQALGLAATCHYLICFYVWSDDPDSHRKQAVDIAHHLLRVAGDDVYALCCAVLPIADFEHDLASAIAVIDRAISLNPGSALAWSVSSTLRARSDDLDLAVEHVETSMRLDPLGQSRRTQASLLACYRLLQGRYAEAVTLSKEHLQQVENPMSYAFLASTYGYLGQTEPAGEALTRYRSLTSQPIEEFGRIIMPVPKHLKLFLDGIALAEGRPSPDPG